MAILKTPLFWIGLGALGVIGINVAYLLSIETFEENLKNISYIKNPEDNEAWKVYFKSREAEIKNQTKPYSNALDTLIQNTKNKSSYGDGNDYLILKNWCFSRYKDTYVSLFQKPKTQELEEIKKFCRH